MPESVMSTIVLDVQYLFDFLLKSLNTSVTSMLQTAPSMNKDKEMIAYHFSSAHKIFQGFQTHAMWMTYIRQNFSLVVSRTSEAFPIWV